LVGHVLILEFSRVALGVGLAFVWQVSNTAYIFKAQLLFFKNYQFRVELLHH